LYHPIVKALAVLALALLAVVEPNGTTGQFTIELVLVIL
jgi:hypothetical protein